VIARSAAQRSAAQRSAAQRSAAQRSYLLESFLVKIEKETLISMGESRIPEHTQYATFLPRLFAHAQHYRGIGIGIGIGAENRKSGIPRNFSR